MDPSIWRLDEPRPIAAHNSGAGDFRYGGLRDVVGNDWTLKSTPADEIVKGDTSKNRCGGRMKVESGCEESHHDSI